VRHPSAGGLIELGKFAIGIPHEDRFSSSKARRVGACPSGTSSGYAQRNAGAQHDPRPENGFPRRKRAPFLLRIPPAGRLGKWLLCVGRGVPMK
jgi:hypothetical protein